MELTDIKDVEEGEIVEGQKEEIRIDVTLPEETNDKNGEMEKDNVKRKKENDKKNKEEKKVNKFIQ